MVGGHHCYHLKVKVDVPAHKLKYNSSSFLQQMLCALEEFVLNVL